MHFITCGVATLQQFWEMAGIQRAPGIEPVTGQPLYLSAIHLSGVYWSFPVGLSHTKKKHRKIKYSFMRLIHCPFNYNWRLEGYVFGPVCCFVCRSGHLQDYIKTTGQVLIKLKKGEAWAKKEPIIFWNGSRSRGRYTNYFSLSLTLRVIEFDLSGWRLTSSSKR